MTAATQTHPAHPANRSDKALAMALGLAHAENALHEFTAGQVDAIVDPSGKTYLLRGAQEELRRSKGELEALIDSASDLITVINRGGKIVSQNKAAKNFVRGESGEMVGRSFFELVHEDDLTKVHAAFFYVIDGFRESSTLEFRHLTEGGGYRTVEAAITKVRDGHLFRTVLICRDLSGRRAAQLESLQREAALVEESQSKDRFIAMLSHELRTPLSPVLLGVQDCRRMSALRRRNRRSR